MTEKLGGRKNVAAVAKRAFEAAADGNNWSSFSSKDEAFVDSVFVEAGKEWELVREAHGQEVCRDHGVNLLSPHLAGMLLGKLTTSILKEAYLLGQEVFCHGVNTPPKMISQPIRIRPNRIQNTGNMVGRLLKVPLKELQKSVSGLFMDLPQDISTGKLDPVYHFSSEIQGQLWIANILWVLAGFTFFYMIIGSRRRLSADAESLTTETACASFLILSMRLTGGSGPKGVGLFGIVMPMELISVQLLMILNIRRLIRYLNVC